MFKHRKYKYQEYLDRSERHAFGPRLKGALIKICNQIVSDLLCA